MCFLKELSEFDILSPWSHSHGIETVKILLNFLIYYYYY